MGNDAARRTPIGGLRDIQTRLHLLELRFNKSPVASGATADRPSAPPTGKMFFDTTLGKPIWWDGADWVDATGATA